MLEKDYKLTDGSITKSSLPPQQSFQIEKNNKIVHFTAFAELFNDDTALITAKQRFQMNSLNLSGNFLENGSLKILIKTKGPFYKMIFIRIFRKLIKLLLLFLGL